MTRLSVVGAVETVEVAAKHSVPTHRAQNHFRVLTPAIKTTSEQKVEVEVPSAALAMLTWRR